MEKSDGGVQILSDYILGILFTVKLKYLRVEESILGLQTL